MNDEVEQAIEEVLQGKPRARELEMMISALEIRRDTFRRERDSTDDPDNRREWESRLQETESQIATLREELAITEFVENSVRVTLNKPSLDDPDEG
jgi:hypothetical protein